VEGKTESDFAVVGAGLAGLRTAADLSAAGATVTVLEARERVGGRVVSAPPLEAPPLEPPLTLDLGAQWVGPGQTEVMRLISELGLATIPTAVPGRALWGLDGQLKRGSAWLPPLPPRALAEVLAAVARAALMSRRLPAEAPWQSAQSAEWDRVSAADWVAKHVRTAAGRDFARIYIKGNMAAEPDETSLLGLLVDLRSIGSIRHLLSAETFRVREGTHEIARRLAAKITGEIRFGSPVRAITQDSAGVTVAWDDGMIRCRRVAVCVPPRLASQISYSPVLPERRARLLASLPMGASVKFHAVYPRPFWRERGLSGQALIASGTVGLTYDNSPDDGTGRGVLVGLVVADEARRLGRLNAAGQEQEILASLSRLFGPDAATPAALVVKNWDAEEWTGGCYAAHFPVNVWTTLGSAFREPCGRVHWAGTETASEWYGYMEGALRSGIRAAVEMRQGNLIALGHEPGADLIGFRRAQLGIAGEGLLPVVPGLSGFAGGVVTAAKAVVRACQFPLLADVSG
jgi:monoamine oxidase